MSELGELHSLTTARLQQNELRNLYSLLPSPDTKRKIITVEFPNSNDIQVPYYDLSKPNELSEKVISQISLLLQNVPITKSMKSHIVENFKAAFKIGENKDDSPTFDVLGITAAHPLVEGIFSQNPEERMKIERESYMRIKNAVEEMGTESRNVFNEPSSARVEKSIAFIKAEVGSEFVEELKQWEKEFLTHYDEELDHGPLPQT
jgi:hypothetical protein